MFDIVINHLLDDNVITKHQIFDLSESNAIKQKQTPSTSEGRGIIVIVYFVVP